MHNPNLSQLLFLLNNNQDKCLSKMTSEEDFLILFLEHLTEYFNNNHDTFKILEPLLDPEIEKEQQTVLAINGIEVGELHLLCNSVFNQSSLVYYSPSGLLELYLLDFDDYFELKISDYVLLLNEFASLLYGEKNLYEKLQKPYF